MADLLRRRSSAAIPARPAGGAAVRAGHRAQGRQQTVRGLYRGGTDPAQRRHAWRPHVLAGRGHRPGPPPRGRATAGGTRGAGERARRRGIRSDLRRPSPGRAHMSGPRRADGPAHPNGPAAHPNGSEAGPGGATSPGSRTIIPLMPGVARPRGERRVLMREAVIEVVHHLVLKAVPPQERSPLFDQARDLLTEAGWGLDELFEAAEEGPARSALFRALGLEE